MSDLFDDLCHHYGLRPRRDGEVYIPSCPFCGKESSWKKVHCSYSRKGFKCFTCGRGAGLVELARQLGMDVEREPEPVQRVERPEPAEAPPGWLANGEAWVRTYEAHPRRFELWDGYKALPREVIVKKRLGVGVLPASRCNHERLVVPLFEMGGKAVGLRGRQLACECGKWLVAKGTPLERLPLYNCEALWRRQVVVIVENPIDALLITAMTEYIGVASYSVSYWRSAWTERLRLAGPEVVIVAYDNDLPGNGGALRRDEMLAAWKKKQAESQHKEQKPPAAAGPRLANELRGSGLPAVLYDWGNSTEKDFGGMLLKQPANALYNAPASPQDGSRT